MASKTTASFSKGVFINCPYDKPYIPLLRSALFTLIRLGYEPKTAADRMDCKEIRLDKIADLIPLCRFGIHDLSRNRASRKGEYYRMNMPFELGIDWAWEHYAGKSAGHGSKLPKKFLILETKGRSAKAAISDLSGTDFREHGDQPQKLIATIRDFFFEHGCGDAGHEYPDAVDVWREYNEFLASLQYSDNGRKRTKAELDRMIVTEFCAKARAWIGRLREGSSSSRA